ncbi:MAG: fluoride efflux transporter CrcB [Acidobacteriaceae bacterium]
MWGVRKQDDELQKYLLVALGGALGSLLRFWVGTFVASRMGVRFPYGTLIINITACVIIGFSLEFLGRHVELTPAWRYLIPIGFVGAYSTFSTFEWETFTNLQSGGFLVASLYVSSSILLGLIAIWGGVAIAKSLP